MADQDSIRAVNLLIRDHVVRHCYGGNMRTAVDLVNKRFTGKFEEPRSDTSSSRRSDAWLRWINFDEGLQPSGLLGPGWAKARLWIHQLLADFRLGEMVFTNGSSFEPLGNQTSIACKLSGTWTITADCFDLFAKYSYWHRALRHAVKKRFKRYCTSHDYSERSLNRRLWREFGHLPDFAFHIYSVKLFCVVKFVRGNRWSTVPKNNLKDRSICLEPLCNMLVQRAVGLGLRRCLKDNAGIDLDHLADVHRNRISDETVATIDLSDCSDAISMRLIKYLLPKRIFNKISACRSDMTFGPDGNYYVVNKVSSMGNGFTFDLMTVVLTALTRSFDMKSSVFGDDIICQTENASEIISNLQLAGFVVNLDKTNVGTGYRESCGAHFIDGYGYVTSFDIKWITTVHELIVTMNKVAILAHIYGDPYETLRARIWTCVPQSWLGATTKRLVVDRGKPPSYELDTFVRYGPTLFVEPNRHKRKLIRRFQKDWQKPGNISVAIAFTNRLERARNSLNSNEWDVFFQHLHNIRLSRKIPRVVLKSSLVARIDEEQIGFIGSLSLPKDSKWDDLL